MSPAGGTESDVNKQQILCCDEEQKLKMCKCHAVIKAQLLPPSNRSTVSLTGEERTSSIIISSVLFTKQTTILHANGFHSGVFFLLCSFPSPLKVYKRLLCKKKSGYAGYDEAVKLSSLSASLHNTSQKVLKGGLCCSSLPP